MLLKILAALMTLLVAVILGAAAAANVEYGPTGTLIGGVVIAAIAAAVVWFITRHMLDMYSEFPVAGAIFCASVAFAITMSGAVSTYYSGSADAAVERQISAEITTFGVAHFAELDIEHTGNLTEKDLTADLARLPKDQKSYRLVWYIRAHMDDIGHEIGRVSKHYVYAVSQSDIATFHDRVLNRWKFW